MKENEKSRLIEAAYRSRKGKATSGDNKFCEQMLKKYPSEYGDITKIGRQMADDEVNPFNH